MAISTINTNSIGLGQVTPADLSQPMTLSTAQATTSGTFKDFTGIPSWVKRITVMFNGVSTNGSSLQQVQLGAGSVTTSGYTSAASQINATTAGSSASSTGLLFNGANAASVVLYGNMTITNISGNTWIASGTTSRSDATSTNMFGGAISLSGTLDRVRITTVNGTDIFDAGSINILYEG